jgi:hypothetical protein
MISAIATPSRTFRTGTLYFLERQKRGYQRPASGLAADQARAAQLGRPFAHRRQANPGPNIIAYPPAVITNAEMQPLVLAAIHEELQFTLFRPRVPHYVIQAFPPDVISGHLYCGRQRR